MLNRMMCGACGCVPHKVYTERLAMDGYATLVLECTKCGSRTKFVPSTFIEARWEKKADGSESPGRITTAGPELARLDADKKAVPLTFLSAPAKRASRGATTHVDRKTGKRTRLR